MMPKVAAFIILKFFGSSPPGLASFVFQAEGGNFAAPSPTDRQNSAIENSVRARLRIRGDDIGFKKFDAEGKISFETLQGLAAGVLENLDDDNAVRIQDAVQDSDVLCDLMQDEPDITLQAKAWISFLDPSKDSSEHKSSDSSAADSKGSDSDVSSPMSKMGPMLRVPGRPRKTRTKNSSNRRRAHTSPTSVASSLRSHFSISSTNWSCSTYHDSPTNSPQASDVAEPSRGGPRDSAAATNNNNSGALPRDTGSRAAGANGECDKGTAVPDASARGLGVEAGASRRRKQLRALVSFEDEDPRQDHDLRLRQQEKREKQEEQKQMSTSIISENRQTTSTLDIEDKDGKHGSLSLASLAPAVLPSVTEHELTSQSTIQANAGALKKTKSLSRKVSFGGDKGKPQEQPMYPMEQKETKLREDANISILSAKRQTDLLEDDEGNDEGNTKDTRTTVPPLVAPVPARPPRKHPLRICVEEESTLLRHSTASSSMDGERLLSPKFLKSDKNPAARRKEGNRRPDSPIQSRNPILARLHSAFNLSPSARSTNSSASRSPMGSVWPDSSKPKYEMFSMFQQTLARGGFSSSDEEEPSGKSSFPGELAGRYFGSVAGSLSSLSLGSPGVQRTAEDDVYDRAATWLSCFAVESALGTSFQATAQPGKETALFGPHLPSVLRDRGAPSLGLPVGRPMTSGAAVGCSTVLEAHSWSTNLTRSNTPLSLYPQTNMSEIRDRIPSVVHEEDEYDTSDSEESE
eukprot:GEMP01004896.1.p1 GENE.GEMP01004896.1~~GEMP01004896.1.p1  ORF type:complete len:748 (+),score=182.17 GEMP01004896.1:471-2714(+)